MKELKSEFLLPIKGLQTGIHQFAFQLTSDFFGLFDHALIREGEYDVSLSLEKKHSMMILDFDVEGSKTTPCDVCLKPISIPSKGHEQYVVRFGTANTESQDVVYIDPEESELDISDMILETIQLHLPLINKIDCESNDYRDCDQKMLEYLDQIEEDEEEGNDIWGELKNIKLK